MKRKLIILFNEYPYRAGEYSFVRTELEVLAKQFEICIISLSTSLAEQKMTTDKRIAVYHCIRKFGIKEKLSAVAKYLFGRYGCSETIRILKSGQNIVGRLYDSIVFFGEADQLRKYVKKNRLINGNELVYSYWFNANCLAFLMDKKRYPDIRVVSRIHGYDLYNERNSHGRQPFREYMDRKIDRLFFVADAGLEYYMRRWGKSEEFGDKYMVAPIGTTCEDFQKDRIFRSQEKVFHLVSCSGVIPLKRVELIVEGLARIENIKIRWTHFGAGDCYDEVKECARIMLSVKSNISYEMPGFVPLEEIKEIYAKQHVDCFITTSSTEGCPVSIQEAMSYGIPIIATAVGEIPSMIEGNGILLPENPSPEEVEEAVRCMRDFPREKLLRMRERSREKWETRYNAVENADRFLMFLDCERQSSGSNND